MKQIVILLVAVLLSACASPRVDQAALNFDREKYEADLFRCRGGNLIKATASTIGFGVVGSVFGALNGASFGAIARYGAEAALVVGAIGGIVGLVAGFEEQRKKHDDEIAGCLNEKGYTLTR